MTNIIKKLFKWVIIAFLLTLIPLLIMVFTQALNWGLFDFVFIVGLILITGITYEIFANKYNFGLYKVAVGIICINTMLIIWINSAVGIVGNSSNTINTLYLGIVLIQIIGAILYKFKPEGMSNLQLIIAIYQLLIPIIGFISKTSFGSLGIPGTMVLNFILTVPYLLASYLFCKVHQKTMNTID